MVFIKSLNKNIWPFYVAPKEDELFTSWFYRMSLECGIRPIPFSNSCFGRDTPFWNRDIDFIIPKKIIQIVLKYTPLNKEEVINMSLQKYSGLAFENLKLNSHNFNVNPIGVKHRKRKQYGLVYCPSCINDNYFRISWRLQTSIFCVKCKKRLIDRCFKCNEPISFYRINFGRKKRMNEFLFFCSNCGADLRKVNIQEITLSELLYQNFIDTTIRLGYNHVSNYSFSYIKVLLMLSSKVKTSSDLNQFKINFQEKYNIKIEGKREMFYLTSIEDKRKILVKVNEMLMGWPETFFKVYRLKKFNNSNLVDNIDKMPYWVYFNLKFKS
ncbi:TniQ family protein [Tenacibaculum sp. TC6]|uniref:TniQ family protein n=1 Tax=Tenacibaculum sp. TC6 TaxID=3423223 RepID=UPI003D364893